MSFTSPKSKRRALVLDDHQEIIDIIAKLLRKLDCEVISETDDAAALGQFALHHFDFVIQDFRRPSGSGATFLRQIRNLEEGKGRVPVVIVTGQLNETVYGELALEGLSFDEEVFALLKKPFELYALQVLLQPLLSVNEVE
jgi:CheY-like chemotaxis protein